ncbi:MAG: leucyl aminopeptidase [Cyanobacteria bacterium K_DeepCast_35m_m2_023]|nr:leucyl aminopeptidase [Cyanobacteria bacterium K_DeepCast_35m_m2_023]
MDVRCLSINLNDAAALQQLGTEALAIGVFSAYDQQSLRQWLDLGLSASEQQALQQRLEQRRFQAKPGEVLSVDRLGHHPATLILVGLGEPAGFDLAALRLATASACKAASGTPSLALALPIEALPADAAAQAMAEAARLSLYTDQRFKSEAEPARSFEPLLLVGVPESFEQPLRQAAAICSGVELARQLVAAPPNVATPQHLAETAQAMASEHGLELNLLDRAACQSLGMGAYLGVSQGSDLPPQFIHLIYRPSGAVQRRVALVGKGLTFDSGGYNLKVAGSQIELMKFDMGGSAAVLGAMRAIAELRPEGLEIHMIVAACENMISGGAVRPGDIVTASNGKTIEINNTDAEGRLTLADALVYACKLEPDAVIDVATLTGACVIALGDEIAGLWSNNDGLADALSTAAQQGGESLWRMPLRSSYKDGLKSGVADLKNTGPRPGGSITAALFLQDFVSPGTPWAHLDIAGTVWSDKGRGCDPAGATGFGVRTLSQWLLAGAPAEPSA